MHTIRHDQLLRERETPWLHGMRLSEMLPLDLRVCVPGDRIALGLGDAIVKDFALYLLVDAESRRLSRLRVFVVLNDDSSGHG